MTAMSRDALARRARHCMNQFTTGPEDAHYVIEGLRFSAVVVLLGVIPVDIWHVQQLEESLRRVDEIQLANEIRRSFLTSEPHELEELMVPEDDKPAPLLERIKARIGL